MSDNSDSSDEQLVLASRKHKITKQKNGTKQSKNTKDEISFSFGKNKRVKIYYFKDIKLVDIRSMYTNKNGEQMPSKKGLSLTRSDFFEFIDLIDDIKKHLNQFNQFYTQLPKF